MDIVGMWKIAEVNAMDKNFKQSWKTVGEMAADPEINPMQKAMAQMMDDEPLYEEERRRSR